MKKIVSIMLGLVLLGAAGTMEAQSTLTITGTGSGTLNGAGFTDNPFVWTVTYSTDNPYLAWGASSPVYTVLSSQLTLNGDPLTVSVTGGGSASGMWFNWGIPGLLALAPMFGNPGGNILSVYADTEWDGSTAYNSTAISMVQFNQFQNLATSSGALTMSSGSVGSLAITGVAPVPEPSTLALAGLGGLGLLLLRRRK